MHKFFFFYLRHDGQNVEIPVVETTFELEDPPFFERSQAQPRHERNKMTPQILGWQILVDTL